MVESGSARYGNTKLLAAAGVGAALETFELTLFGIFVRQIGRTFFPSVDPRIEVVAAFATFAVAFIGRPIGALVFGHLGDSRGRKTAMSISILAMSSATAAIGIIPGYATIGVLAPILLVTVRMIQGFAMAGEVSGVITFLVEYGRKERRGCRAGFAITFFFAGNIFGVLVALAIDRVLGPDAVSAWGWRLPFFLALPAGLIGLYLRLNFADTPEFDRAKAAGHLLQAPVRAAFVTRWRTILLIVLLYAGQVASSHVTNTYMANHLETILGVSRSVALVGYSLAIGAGALTAPAWGLVGDRIGHRRALLIANAGLLAYALPLFLGVEAAAHHPVLITLIQVGFGGLVGCFAASLAFAAATAFPTNIRYSGSTMGYNLSIMLFGGTFPLIAATLVSQTGSSISPAYYLAALLACSLIAGTMVVERDVDAAAAPVPSPA